MKSIHSAERQSEDLMARGADRRGGRGDPGPRHRPGNTGLGGCGCWPLDSLPLCLNYNQNTHTSNPRTAKSISDSVTNVTCKNRWPTDVSGKPSHCADFKTANTQNLTFNIQTQREREEHNLWTQRVKLLKMLPVERRRYTDSLSKALHIVTLGNMSPGDILKKTKKNY